MDLPLVFNSLFNGENVSPDMSSIEAIRLHWRGSEPCPTDEEIVAKWNEIKTSVEYAKRPQEYAKRGVTIDQMIVALWEKVVENKSESADSLQAIREQVKTELPKP